MEVELKEKERDVMSACDREECLKIKSIQYMQSKNAFLSVAAFHNPTYVTFISVSLRSVYYFPTPL